VRKLGFTLLGVIALVAAIFVIGELNETDEDADEPGRTTTTAEPPRERTETEATPGPDPGPDEPDVDPRLAAIERAALAYLERAERGEVGPPGLPTSDEASIRRITMLGPSNGAIVDLTGGARIDLRRRAGRWVVTDAIPAHTDPHPPSGPP
jgi:hypothetical protein